MFRVVERSKLSRKFGNETFMDCHLSSEEEEDEFVAETLRTILLDVDDDDFERDDFDDDDDDFEENTTGDDFVAASNILNKSAKVKDFCAKCECDCCGRECVVFTRERRRRNRRSVSLCDLGLFEKRKVQTFAHDVIKYYGKIIPQTHNILFKPTETLA